MQASTNQDGMKRLVWRKRIFAAESDKWRLYVFGFRLSKLVVLLSSDYGHSGNIIISRNNWAAVCEWSLTCGNTTTLPCTCPQVLQNIMWQCSKTVCNSGTLLRVLFTLRNAISFPSLSFHLPHTLIIVSFKTWFCLLLLWSLPSPLIPYRLCL